MSQNPTDPMTPVRALIAAHAEMGSHSNGDESQADKDMRWSKFMAASYNATASISQLLAEHDKVVAYIAELRAKPEAPFPECAEWQRNPDLMTQHFVWLAYKNCANRLAAIVEWK